MEKERQLEILDTSFQNCLERTGTVKEGMNIAYYLKKQIERCEYYGATRLEIDAIINKYLGYGKRKTCDHRDETGRDEGTDG